MTEPPWHRLCVPSLDGCAHMAPLHACHHAGSRPGERLTPRNISVKATWGLHGDGALRGGTGVQAAARPDSWADLGATPNPWQQAAPWRARAHFDGSLPLSAGDWPNGTLQKNMTAPMHQDCHRI